MKVKTYNPFNGELLHQYDYLTHDEIKDRIERSWTAYKSFKDTDIDTRIEKIVNVSKIMKENKQRFAELMTAEMGKPIKQGHSEVDKCIAYCEYYAENGKQFLSDLEVKSTSDKCFVAYQPLGPLMLYQPWNFPMWLVFKTVIPQLVVGNTVLVKNASNTPLSGIELEKVFLEAGFDEGIYQYFPINYKDSEVIISDKRIRGVSVTGSAQSGRSVGALCGQYIKPCVMELGGSDPLVVLDDADLGKAASLGVTSRLNNNAQACTNAKRFIAVDAVYDEFKDKICQELDKVKLGDPSLEDTALGPLAKKDSLLNLREQVRKSIELGAKVVYGDESQLTAELDVTKGCFFSPMVLEDIPKESPAYTEELFGPVISLFRVKDEHEAIEIANDHEYGLSGAVFGADVAKAEKVARQIETGMININDISRGKRELPSGGVKNSGFGRESGMEGVRQFTNIRAVTIMY